MRGRQESETHNRLHQIKKKKVEQVKMEWGDVSVRPGQNGCWMLFKFVLNHMRGTWLPLIWAAPHLAVSQDDKSSPLQVIHPFESRSTYFWPRSGGTSCRHDRLLLWGRTVENNEGTYQAVCTSVWFFSHSRTWRYMTIIWNHTTTA